MNNSININDTKLNLSRCGGLVHYKDDLYVDHANTLWKREVLDTKYNLDLRPTFTFTRLDKKIDKAPITSSPPS